VDGETEDALAAAKGYADGIALGVGQTWQNLRTSRAVDTVYTNTTGKPIEVNVTIQAETTSYGYASLFIDDVQASTSSARMESASTNHMYNVHGTVQAGSTYKVILTNAITPCMNNWSELR
jgi:hypothetical protein